MWFIFWVHLICNGKISYWHTVEKLILSHSVIRLQDYLTDNITWISDWIILAVFTQISLKWRDRLRITFSKSLVRLDCQLRICHQTSFLILNQFKSIVFCLKSSEDIWFFDNFRGNRSWLTHLNSLSIRKEIFGLSPIIITWINGLYILMFSMQVGFQH